MNGEALVKLIEEMIDLKLQQHVQANHNLAGLVRWPRLGENPRNNGLHAMQPNNNVGRSSPSMTLEQFWNIVEKAHRASGGDMDKKCVLLDAELRRLPLEEVRSFLGHFDECCDRAYSWELWAAAYIIGGGCSDDSFSDFRSTLVSMGRQTFERALTDPQSLADMDYDADVAHYEGYQYVPTTVERDLSGGQDFPRSRPHPKDPSGTIWDEDKLAELYPKLAEKYDYNGWDAA